MTSAEIKTMASTIKVLEKREAENRYSDPDMARYYSERRLGIILLMKALGYRQTTLTSWTNRR